MVRRDDGFSLVSVMVAFVLLMAIGVGMLSLVLSGLEGASVFAQTMQALHVAEAGLNYAVARMVALAAEAPPSDEAYVGEPGDVAMDAANPAARGTFRLTVSCLFPAHLAPPACGDDPSTPVDERDFRRIVSRSAVPRRAGVARRQIEAVVRRYTLGGDSDIPGICGRESVELIRGTWAITDVGSNGTVRIDGAAAPPGTVRARMPRAPTTAPTVEAVTTSGTSRLSGSYTWRVTFVDASGLESAGSPPTLTIRLSDEQARLTNIPVGEATVGRRRIYRSRGDAPAGPWFLVAEISDNRTTDYVDAQPDTTLLRPMPAFISGSVVSAGPVSCAIGCDLQVEGAVRESVREVICPNFPPPPARPGGDRAGEAIVQTAKIQALHLQSLIVGEDGLTIQTLSAPGAELHLHTPAIDLAPGAILTVTGAATVYFHVAGPVVLAEDAVFGAMDSSGNLVTQASRVVIFSTAKDPSGDAGTPSVRLLGNNRMAAVVFAPSATIDIVGAREVRGALFGRSVRVADSTNLVLDPNEGLRSLAGVIRPSPFQYIRQWYDNPNPPGGD